MSRGRRAVGLFPVVGGRAPSAETRSSTPNLLQIDDLSNLTPSRTPDSDPPPPHARHHAVQDHQEEPWLAAPPLCRRPRGAPGLQQVRHHRRRLVARPARERPRGKTRPSPQPSPLPWLQLSPDG
jgi:hypothetical protein